MHSTQEWLYYLHSLCSESFPWTTNHPGTSQAGGTSYGIHLNCKLPRDFYSTNLSGCTLNPCKLLPFTTSCSKERHSSALPCGESPHVVWICPLIYWLLTHNLTSLDCLKALNCLAFSLGPWKAHMKFTRRPVNFSKPNQRLAFVTKPRGFSRFAFHCRCLTLFF